MLDHRAPVSPPVRIASGCMVVPLPPRPSPVFLLACSETQAAFLSE
ncbi:hypothetical protein [Sagittula stellata]|nr:hypothetical protein [Sagittula stellata]